MKIINLLVMREACLNKVSPTNMSVTFLPIVHAACILAFTHRVLYIQIFLSFLVKKVIRRH